MAGALPVSPLAPAQFPDLPEIKGVRFATAAAGVKYEGRDDVMLAHLAEGSVLAGAFTRSATRAAPVRWCEAHIGAANGGPFAVLVNSGNANAFTGKLGDDAMAATLAALGERLDLPTQAIFPASTGVIGEPLPAEKVVAKIDALADALTPGGAKAAARAIMTTDTFPKGASSEVTTPDGPIRIAGFAKGSGMIAPDMATMLVYIFTDATISREALQALVDSACGRTFNAITVDGDTSTSDTLLVGASCQGPEAGAGFADALEDVMRDLAHQVVRDGEGATKFVEVTVAGAVSDASAKTIALSIANSPLVKTAIAGEDPNWGRIVMAIGKAGEPAERDLISVHLGDVLVAEKGWVAAGYREEDGAAHMKGEEIAIRVALGLGAGEATVWTCDLTHQYITINADYRS